MNSKKFINFLKKLQRGAGKPIIVIADDASFHTSSKVVSFTQQTKKKITLGHLPAHAPELNSDEQVCDHAKACLAKIFINSKVAVKRNMLNIMRSIQKNTKLIRSFFQLETTQYASA